jgi:hypothetical protein
MEDHLVSLLTAAQSSNGNERRQAELTLKQAKTNDEFPLALARIAGHASVPIEVRQAALSTLRLFIEANWNPEDLDDSEEPIIHISEPTREHLKAMLLELVLSTEDERKIKTAARYVLGALIYFGPQSHHCPGLKTDRSFPSQLWCLQDRLIRLPRQLAEPVAHRTTYYAERHRRPGPWSSCHPPGLG